MMIFDDLIEGQKNVFNIVMKVIKEKKYYVIINGFVGIGKIIFIKFIIEVLIFMGEIGIILVVFIYVVKKIFLKLLGKEVSIIYSIFKINLVIYEENVFFE